MEMEKEERLLVSQAAFSGSKEPHIHTHSCNAISIQSLDRSCPVSLLQMHPNVHAVGLPLDVVVYFGTIFT